MGSCLKGKEKNGKKGRLNNFGGGEGGEGAPNVMQFSENICSEEDLRSRIFGTFVVKFLDSLPLLGFSNI